jgi:hypothetical protein
VSLLQVDETEHKFRIIYEVACEFVDEECLTPLRQDFSSQPCLGPRVLSRLFLRQFYQTAAVSAQAVAYGHHPSFDEPRIYE